ncbi:DUF3455 domain-containing protein [Caballeronia sp. INDeC2]|uniref:DUF3455 domain-containing protein n=1 Tax=Caballeronia sp. INDeC2 TaxID=2921747 RepID=UPI002028C37F|nr:DUF3455 domain-containing protein [Caballeronia sp. INDeC2]
MIGPTFRTRLSIAAGVVLAMTAWSAQAESIEPPDARASFSASAAGVQIYACEYDANHVLGWTFRQPRATLFDDHGVAVIEHSAGPSWEARDGSRIEGRVLVQTPSDAPGSVPQLLLRARSTGAPGQLSPVRYVQRVKTMGGAKPSAPCTVEHESGSSPYIATYVFYQ